MKTPFSQPAEVEFYRRNELDVIMDDEDAARQDLLRVGQKTLEWFTRGLRILAIQKGVRNFAFDCYLIAIGQGELIGIQSAVEVAKIYKVTKQAATECIDDFQKPLKIPPLPGQRTESGRKGMILARKQQLKGTK